MSEFMQVLWFVNALLLLAVLCRPSEIKLGPASADVESMRRALGNIEAYLRAMSIQQMSAIASMDKIAEAVTEVARKKPEGANA